MSPETTQILQREASYTEAANAYMDAQLGVFRRRVEELLEDVEAKVEGTYKATVDLFENPESGSMTVVIEVQTELSRRAAMDLEREIVSRPEGVCDKIPPRISITIFGR